MDTAIRFLHKHFFPLAGAVVLLAGWLLLAGPAAAQMDACPAVVGDALTVIGDVCEETGRDEICYGSSEIELTPLPNVRIGPFAAPGDLVGLEAVEALTTFPFGEADMNWGVALLKLQANLPDTPPDQHVTVLLFGDAELRTTEESLDTFYFRSQVEPPDCAIAPDGMLIQSPEDFSDPIELVINDVAISLQGTAYVVAEAEETMRFYLLEGTASLAAAGTAHDLATLEMVSVPLDAELSAADALSAPESFAPGEIPFLPLSLLERDITGENEDLQSSSTLPPTRVS